MVSDAERQMMRRTCLAPTCEKSAHIASEADTCVGITRLWNIACDGRAFRRDHTEFAVSVNVYTEQSHWTCLQRKLNTDTAARFAVILLKLTKSWLALGNGDIVRSVVTDEHYVVGYVEGMYFGRTGAPAIQRVANGSGVLSSSQYYVCILSERK